jgi:hypothetical protein
MMNRPGTSLPRNFDRQVATPSSVRPHPKAVPIGLGLSDASITPSAKGTWSNLAGPLVEALVSCTNDYRPRSVAGALV